VKEIEREFKREEEISTPGRDLEKWREQDEKRRNQTTAFGK